MVPTSGLPPRMTNLSMKVGVPHEKSKWGVGRRSAENSGVRNLSLLEFGITCAVPMDSASRRCTLIRRTVRTTRNHPACHANHPWTGVWEMFHGPRIRNRSADASRPAGATRDAVVRASGQQHCAEIHHVASTDATITPVLCFDFRSGLISSLQICWGTGSVWQNCFRVVRCRTELIS